LATPTVGANETDSEPLVMSITWLPAPIGMVGPSQQATFNEELFGSGYGCCLTEFCSEENIEPRRHLGGCEGAAVQRVSVKIVRAEVSWHLRIIRPEVEFSRSRPHCPHQSISLRAVTSRILKRRSGGDPLTERRYEPEHEPRNA